MGKKAHPSSLRTEFTGWKQAVWHTDQKHFAQFIAQDILIRDIIDKSFEEGLIANSSIERAGSNLIITLFSHRPGIIIGKQGVEVDKFKKKISAQLNTNVDINVSEISKPELDPFIISYNIAKQISSRGDYKKIVKASLKFAMRAGAKGISIAVSGRLGGAAIAKLEKYKKGSVSLNTFRDRIYYSKRQAKTVYGICGVQVRVSLGVAGGKDVISTKWS